MSEIGDLAERDGISCGTLFLVGTLESIQASMSENGNEVTALRLLKDGKAKTYGKLSKSKDPSAVYRWEFVDSLPLIGLYGH